MARPVDGLSWQPTMGAIFYRMLRSAAQLIRVQAIRHTQLNADRVDRDGGFVLACTHISHIEPLVLSCGIGRQVRWVARREFYRYWLARCVLNTAGTVQIDRFGSPLVGIRNAARLAGAGECVGIFPEGGIAKGSNSILGGASAKGGMCSIAIEANVPIVPVVVLGTDRLETVASWIPLPRTHVCYGFGRDVCPPPRGESRHSRRVQMTHAVELEFRRLYADMIARVNIDHAKLPAAAHHEEPLDRVDE